MNKFYISIVTLFLGLTLHAQADTVFRFPSEMELITAISCAQENNPNDCTMDLIESRIKPILEKYRKKVGRDTLRFAVELYINPDGSIKKQRFSFALNKNDNTLKKKISQQLENALASESFKVSNYNAGIYSSVHRFDYKYLIQRKNKSIESLPVTDRYSGGKVLMIPLFPYTPRRGDELDRQGFQEEMQNHIRKHFRYPVQALERGIQGAVYTMFTIDKRGSVTQLKMRSPHPLLEAEARRIISLLPIFQPAIQDGKAVKVPYSIPIHFRLYTGSN